MNKENIFKKVYDFYSTGLTTAEVERTFRKDALTRYNYYLRSMDKPEEHNNKFFDFVSFTKNFFIAFLKKLTPVTRLIYTVGIIFFIVAAIFEIWEYAALAFLIMNVLLIYEVAEKLTARDELVVAKDVQTGLIPIDAPPCSTYDISFHYETAKEVGGDFMDFIPKPDGSYYVSIGDISGKGMSAALYMVQIRLLLRYLSELFDEPKAILTSLNKNIFKHIKRGLYFSAILAEIKKDKIKVCRAGHTPVLYYSSEKKKCCEIKQNGMALGLSNGNLFEGSLEEFEFKPNSGDILLFYSDGLTESMNEEKKEFGIERVKYFVNSFYHASPQDLKEILINEIAKFRGYAEVHDDITMIILKAK